MATIAYIPIVHAAGTTQETATSISANYNVVAVVPVAANTGIRLPIPTTVGAIITVINKGTNDLNVYPASGGIIDAAIMNAAAIIQPGTIVTYQASSTTQWHSITPATAASQEQQKVITLRLTPHIKMLHTTIRNRASSRMDFILAADQLNRLLIEEGLNQLPMCEKHVTTPTGAEFVGLEPEAHICGVSILRSGEAMETALRQVCGGIRIGKILIQRDETTKKAILIYAKLPRDIATRRVLLMDPMLATGGSACAAVQVLLEKGVPENHIIFLNLIAAPEGLKHLHSKYPRITVVTTMIDDGLNADAYIMPGIGDFGDRYFGTV